MDIVWTLTLLRKPRGGWKVRLVLGRDVFSSLAHKKTEHGSGLRLLRSFVAFLGCNRRISVVVVSITLLISLLSLLGLQQSSRAIQRPSPTGGYHVGGPVGPVGYL